MISEAKALELIHELEMKRLSSFSSLVDQANEQLCTLQSRGLEGFHWEDHLTQVVKTGERAHMCGLVHKIPYFAAVPPEFYIDIPESFPVNDKDGWQLLTIISMVQEKAVNHVQVERLGCAFVLG